LINIGLELTWLLLAANNTGTAIKLVAKIESDNNFLDINRILYVPCNCLHV
jgi:hypothetical protein